MDNAAVRSFSWYKGNLLWLPERTIFLTRHGSHAYGTNIEGSDEDFKGIAVAPVDYYLGNLKSFEQADKSYGVQDLDLTITDIKKFFFLAANANPSVIEVLFTDESDWIIPGSFNTGAATHAFFEVYGNRNLFLSRKVRHTFSGYAMSQLKRIMTHRRWLLNPPKKHPERSDFDLPNAPTLDKIQMGIVEARIRKQEDVLGGKGFTKNLVEDDEDTMRGLVEMAVDEVGIPKNLVQVIFNERRYNNAMRNWEQYQTWKANRNPKRAETEALYGYDTKHAMHLVRLMRMAQEVLKLGKVIVKRPDREELLGIRSGAWPFEKLMEWAYQMDGSLDDLERFSPLPHDPDRKAIDRVLVNTILSFPLDRSPESR